MGLARARFDIGRAQRLVRVAADALKTALRVIEGESVRMRAMALTYISLFALVPALVVAFSVVQAFTGVEKISDRVHEFLLENLAVGARTTLEPYLDRFVQNAHATSAGLVGGALLFWSAVTLFSNVERAVNDIWGIKRRRSVAQQAVIYWVGLTLGPLLLAGSAMLGQTTKLFLASTGVRFLAVAGSAILTCAFFAVLYYIVPNTKVRVRSAVVGGIVAGVAWEVAKWGYTFAVGSIFQYHAIYGSVAAVPIFLLWLFVSWTILLFGARLAYVAQYASTLLQGAPRWGSKTGREILAGQAMLVVARAFDNEKPAPDAGQVASELRATPEEAGEALGALRLDGLIVALADGGLVPSRPLEKITLLDVRRAVGGKEPTLAGSPGLLAEIVKGIEGQAAERLDEVTYRTLCDRERGAASPVAPDHARGGARDDAPAASPA